ncbi:MAG: glycosyltransferase family 39 protein [Anaerolineae bacterium]|nr:glycosyltransferase family 39 protein [Anaerolineae bacterium]
MKRERSLLGLIVAAYVVLAVIYSTVTPLFEASDELWHFPMVQFIAETGGLPVQEGVAPGLWRQEGSQPPLYYMAAALLTAGVDTSDLEWVRRINPHADIGLVRPDGNVNMIVHRAAAEAWPWQGTALAVHLARLFSVALGAGALLVTYALGRRLFPERPEVRLGAAALNAFLPMFLFLSGSVNNDNLSNLLGNLLTLEIVILLGARIQPRWWLYVLIGVTAGAGMLAKFNIGFLLPVIAASLVVLSARLRSPRPLLLGGLISGGLTILIAGWWYARNAQLYGDPTGLNIFLELVGRRAIPANTAQLWAERDSFLQAFWGFFGGVNVPLPGLVYAAFNLIGAIGLIGAAAFLIRVLIRREWPLYRWWPALVALFWPIISFLSYLSWTATTPASQGRLLFAALSSILIWIALGLTWWLPRRARRPLMAVVAGAFALVALLTPFFIIAPAYQPPVLAADTSEAQAVFSADDGPVFSLLEAGVDGRYVQPGDYVQVFTRWRAEAPPGRDWSLFVHLVTPDNVIVAQRDVYPGEGLLAASDLAAGQSWDNPIAIPVPDTALAPMTLTVEAGWYHLPTGERLMLADGSETVTLGEAELVPRSALHDAPNPVSVNFGGQLELIGYEVSDLSPAAGEQFDVTFYWRALQPIAEDYVVFTHLLDPATTTIYAGSDAQPAGWTRPTSAWQPGEIIADTHTLTVNPDTPPGIYELELGAYLPHDGRFDRLRVWTPDGGMANDFTLLTRLRALPAPEATEAAP